jgi:signal transduction histidine kinase
LNIEAHSPADFIEQVSAQAASLAGTRLEIVGRADDAPPFFFFDRYLTELALLNAVHNALQYARRRIEISASADSGGVRFQVRDDSDGYPAHILDNQGRLPAAHASGTGLGLYFAHIIAGAHDNRGRHGHLKLANQDGAVFTLWLP